MTCLDAVILAGGKGERLGALTADTPKPLLEVAGRPFIGHLLVRLARAGLNHVGILAGPFAEKFRAALGDGGDYGLSLKIVPEPVPAGTAGALGYVDGQVADPFVCLNGDSLFDIDFAEFATPPLGAGTDIHLCLRRVADTCRFGRVQIDSDGRVIRFGEKEADGPGLINAGIYRMRASIPSRVGAAPMSLETELIPALVAQGRATGVVLEAPFLDIGVPADFARATSFVESLSG